MRTQEPKSFPIKCHHCGNIFCVEKTELADKILGANVDVLTFPQLCPKCNKAVGTWTAQEPPPGCSAIIVTYKGFRPLDRWVVTIYTKRPSFA